MPSGFGGRGPHGRKRVAKQSAVRSHDAFLAVFEAALLADRWCFVLIAFPIASPTAVLAATLAGISPLIDRHDFDRTHKRVPGRSSCDHRIVLEREVHDPPIARRHRLERYRYVLALGLFAFR